MSNITITIEQPGPGQYVAKLTDESYTGFFTINESGELLEWADDLSTGTPDWDEATCCDPVRGESPELQAYIRALLIEAGRAEA